MSTIDLAAIAAMPDAERIDAIEAARAAIAALSPLRPQPIDRVRWVPIDRVRANDYNPNRVAQVELRLLQTSIMHDGYTQPIVTVADPGAGVFVIVDGFHRYWVCKNTPEILARNRGRVPIVVIDKPLADRMASTVRHNRARGKHTVEGMSGLVFGMLDQGLSDADICRELGMEPQELVRLKHITGFSKLFDDAEYSQAWRVKAQILAAKKAREEGHHGPAA